jgi:very-short-patch-repair endonuclease
MARENPDLAELNPDLLPASKPKAAVIIHSQQPEGDKLAQEFEELWKQADGPELVKEHQFHPLRKWKFDYAHLDTKVAIEIEGGVWTNGRHVRGSGFIGDAEKYNTAAMHGWAVIRLATGMVTREAVEDIVGFIRGQ